MARAESVKSDPKEIAAFAGLRYVTLGSPGLTRRKSGKSFHILNSRGQRVRDLRTVERVKKLAIPPAYRDVWISRDPKAHIQAVGVDARGRKQYRYHPKWTEATNRFKFLHILEFAHAIPAIREITETDLKLPRLERKKVLAAVVQLLEKTLIRVGNDEYAKKNKSYGLSTMKNRHVEVSSSRVVFRFKGKSGVQHEINLADRRLARVVQKCQELPGQELFQYLDEAGARHAIHSQDVNEYLQSITNRPFTAKDFRTWAGTVFAARVLHSMDKPSSATSAKRNLNLAIQQVAERLGNTRAVCRKSYIHPAILEAYVDGERVCTAPESDGHEREVLSFLKKKSKL